MKHAKRLFAFLLCAALLTALATPAYALVPPTLDATITADMKMATAGDSVTLTVTGIPPLEAGQSIRYNWWYGYGDSNGIGSCTTEDPVLQVQVPGRDIVRTGLHWLFNHKFILYYKCQAIVTDSSGIIAYYNGATEVQGYYNFTDSLAVPYEALGDGYMIVMPFLQPIPYAFYAIACLFGIVWSPWVALANSMEAKRVNG